MNARQDLSQYPAREAGGYEVDAPARDAERGEAEQHQSQDQQNQHNGRHARTGTHRAPWRNDYRRSLVGFGLALVAAFAVFGIIWAFSAAVGALGQALGR